MKILIHVDSLVVNEIGKKVKLIRSLDTNSEGKHDPDANSSLNHRKVTGTIIYTPKVINLQDRAYDKVYGQPTPEDEMVMGQKGSMPRPTYTGACYKGEQVHHGLVEVPFTVGSQVWFYYNALHKSIQLDPYSLPEEWRDYNVYPIELNSIYAYDNGQGLKMNLSYVFAKPFYGNENYEEVELDYGNMKVKKEAIVSKSGVITKLKEYESKRLYFSVVENINKCWIEGGKEDRSNSLKKGDIILCNRWAQDEYEIQKSKLYKMKHWDIIAKVSIKNDKYEFEPLGSYVTVDVDPSPKSIIATALKKGLDKNNNPIYEVQDDIRMFRTGTIKKLGPNCEYLKTGQKVLFFIAKRNKWLIGIPELNFISMREADIILGIDEHTVAKDWNNSEREPNPKRIEKYEMYKDELLVYVDKPEMKKGELHTTAVWPYGIPTGVVYKKGRKADKDINVGDRVAIAKEAPFLLNLDSVNYTIIRSTDVPVVIKQKLNILN